MQIAMGIRATPLTVVVLVLLLLVVLVWLWWRRDRYRRLLTSLIILIAPRSWLRIYQRAGCGELPCWG